MMDLVTGCFENSPFPCSKAPRSTHICPFKVKEERICIPPGSDYKADGSESFWKRVVDFPLGWYPSIFNLLVISALASIPPCLINVVIFWLFPVEQVSDVMFVAIHLTYFEMISKPAWIITFSESIPTSMFCKKEAFIAFVVVVLGCKAHDFWLLATGFFPIKFSLIGSGFTGAILLAYLLQAKTENYPGKLCYEKFISSQKGLLALGLSVFLSGLWAAFMLYCKGTNEAWSPWVQVVWSGVFFFLKLGLNSKIVRPYAAEAVPDDFTIFSIYAENLFMRIQVATVPFVTDPAVFGVLCVIDILGPLFICIAAVDRAKLFFARKGRAPVICKAELGQHWRCKVLFCSTQKVCELSLRADDDEELWKLHWVDKHLFTCIATIGNRLVSIIVRSSQLLLVWIVKAFFLKEQVHDRFDGSDSDMQEFSGYAAGRIAAQMISLVLVQVFVMKKLKMKTKGVDQEGDVCRIIDYIVRQHFWQLFFWNVTSGSYVVASMIKQFGFEFFSLNDL